VDYFFFGPLLLGVLTILLIVVVALERARREKHRLELQKAILERVGSVKDLAEFLTTDQGERFLGSLSPTHFRPQRRSLLAVRVGVVFLTIGIFLMGGLHSTYFGSFGEGDMNPPRVLLMAALLLVAAGIGLLLSAAVSFLIARSLGMLDQRRNGTKQDHTG
jgi:hypothetical protein